MTRKAPINKAASVKQCLLNIARKTNQNFDLILRRYALERLLFRLSRTEHKKEFVLKGAMLLYAWRESGFRPTKDLDLLGSGTPSPDILRRTFRDTCEIGFNADGLVYDPDSICVKDSMAAQNYAGLCVSISAFLGKARVPIEIDVGFGDVVIPEPQEIDYPVLLDLPAPAILAYTRESVIAEKFEAMVRLGESNSRMKDYYDIWYLSRNFDFRASLLAEAIIATFQRRRTELPHGYPTGLSDEFFTTPNHQVQWRAFVKRIAVERDVGEFVTVVQGIRNFILPCLKDIKPDVYWPVGGPWQVI